MKKFICSGIAFYAVAVFWSLVFAATLAHQQQRKIGNFHYSVIYSKDTLGEVQFPLDDSVRSRVMLLPLDKLQQTYSLQHEIIHACIHNHSHHFKTQEEMDKHLHRKLLYEDEDQLADTLGLCLADSEIK